MSERFIKGTVAATALTIGLTACSGGNSEVSTAEKSSVTSVPEGEAAKTHLRETVKGLGAFASQVGKWENTKGQAATGMLFDAPAFPGEKCGEQILQTKGVDNVTFSDCPEGEDDSLNMSIAPAGHTAAILSKETANPLEPSTTISIDDKILAGRSGVSGEINYGGDSTSRYATSDKAPNDPTNWQSFNTAVDQLAFEVKTRICEDPVAKASPSCQALPVLPTITAS